MLGQKNAQGNVTIEFDFINYHHINKIVCNVMHYDLL